MAKTVNYTPEMTASIVEAYTSVADTTDERRAEMVRELADRFGKSDRSIRQKLVREGVYVAKSATSKVTGEAPAKKMELAERLISLSPALARVNPENVAKMNKTDIMAFIAAFESEEG